MPKNKKHIYPYSYEKYLIESFNDYLYSILAYTNIELYNMKSFVTRNYRVYSINCLKSVIEKSKLYKFLTTNFRLMINNIDLDCLKVYKNDYSYITSDIMVIEGNRLNILSSSYIPTKYLFNYAKKNLIIKVDSNTIHHLSISDKEIIECSKNFKVDETLEYLNKLLIMRSK